MTVALSGAVSRDLDRQVSSVLTSSPHVAVIMIGANDVTHHVPQRESVSDLAHACRRLRDAGCEVVVGTCPDLGTVEPIQHPLRWLARRWSRQLAAAQTIAVVEAGGRSVSLGDILGPEFAARPRDVRAGPFSPFGGGICRCCKRFAACRLRRRRLARARSAAASRCARGVRSSRGPGRGRGGGHGWHGGGGAGHVRTALGAGSSTRSGWTRQMGPAAAPPFSRAGQQRLERPRAPQRWGSILVGRPPHSRMSSRRVACKTQRGR